MVLLKESFLALQFVGLWASTEWQRTSLKSIVYKFYTFMMMALIHWFTVVATFGLVMDKIEDIADFAHNSFLLLSMYTICIKAIVALVRRSEIVDVLRALESEPHKPISEAEQRIQDEFNYQIGYYTTIYAAQLEISACLITVLTFLQGIPFGTLPYKAWIPWDYSGYKMYWFTFCLELTALLTGANMNIGFDTVVPGFFIQLCAQFNILKCRLTTVIDEFEEEVIVDNLMVLKTTETVVKNYEKRIAACVYYHRSLIEISEKINAIFNPIIFVQYSASSIIICVSVFMLSQLPPFCPQFTSLLMYVTSMLMQIFLLCASGNEVTIECESMINSIYSTNWYLLTNKAKKYLILMMVRTLKPIIFMSGYIIVLSLGSFTSLLKSSYSAYTLLQQFNE